MGKRSRATRQKQFHRARIRLPEPAPRQPELSTAAAAVTGPDAATETPSETPLGVLAELVTARREVEEMVAAQVDVLAAAGTPWPVIAQVLGVSRQAARQAHQRRHTQPS